MNQTSDGLVYRKNKDNTLAIMDYVGLSAEVIIPDEIEGKTVNGVNHSVFADCTHVTDITIPSTVIYMGYPVFLGATNLQNIFVAEDNPLFMSVDGVLYKKTTLWTSDEPDSAGYFLMACPAKKTGTYEILNKTAGIFFYAFSDCTSLTGLIIPKSVTTVYENFNNNSSLKEIYYEGTQAEWEECDYSSVDMLGKENFKIYYEVSLTEPETPVTPTEPTTPTEPETPVTPTEPTTPTEPEEEEIKVGEMVESKTAVYKVTSTKDGSETVAYTQSTGNATKVTIPNTVKVDGISYKVTTVSKNAFKNNKKLKEIKVGSNITKIDKNAFSGCTKLTKLTIGKNVKTIDDKAFYKCTSLTKVTIPSKVKTIGDNAFYGCKKLKKVTIGKNVKTIDDKAFYKCTSLEKVEIPSGVTKIDDYAFYGCSTLKTVVIGKDVKTIGKSAFAGCKKLKTITIKSTKLTKKSIEKNAFKGIYSKATMKVPAKKLNAYKKYLKSAGVGSKVKIKK